MAKFFGGIARWFKKYKSTFAMTIAGLSLLLAQSAFWINQTIFDKQTFTSTTTEVLQSEQSRQAIASSIVDRAFQDRPVLQRTISAKTTQLLTGLLGTDFVVQGQNLVIDKAYTYLTSENQEPIAFDLTAVKEPVARIVGFAESQGREVQFDPNNIPDSITLFDPQNLPDLYSYSVIMLWLGPIFWLTTLVIFGFYIFRGGRNFYAKRVYIVGAIIGIVGLLGLLVGPILPTQVSALVSQPDLRGLVGDFVRAFLQPFTQQMINMLLLTAVILLAFSQRFNALRLLNKLRPASLPADNKPHVTVKQSQATASKSKSTATSKSKPAKTRSKR